MGLNRFKPMPSGRMGIFWVLAGIKDAAVVEFGCMGHNLANTGSLRREGIYDGYGAKLFTTYVDETDIALGDMGRLRATIEGVIADQHPKAIFLQPSAVPEVIGTDLSAMARLLSGEFPGQKIIAVGKGSFAFTQHRGIEEALLSLAKLMPNETERSEAPSFNLIGSCPDLMRYHSDAAEMARLMAGAFGMRPGCILSSAADVAGIEALGAGHLNLAFRREAIRASDELERRFGTPYLYGRPYGIRGTTEYLRAVGEVLGREPDAAFIASEEAAAYGIIDQSYNTLKDNAWYYPEDSTLTIGGHYDVVSGILNFATSELHVKRGTAWCDCPEMADENLPYYSQEDWIPVVENHKKGFLMFSGEALRWAGKNTELEITYPGVAWHIHGYDAPFVGYHGAAAITNMLINDYTYAH